MSLFLSYIKLGENRYREHYGLSFEQFQVGQQFKHRPGITISQQDNKDEALDTINNAQLHYDDTYAAQTEWKHCLGVSTMTLQLLTGMTWKTFAQKKRVLSFDDIAMTHPVFGGDTLYAESEIIKKETYPQDENVGLIHALTKGFNQHHDIVAKIQYQLLIYKAKSAFNLKEEKFSAYYQLADQTYVESVGIYYEDLDVGEIYEHFPAKTITYEENKMHALRSLEWNPMYANLDKEKMPISESFLVGTVTALTTRTFGRVVANLQWKNIQLPTIAYTGDTIRAESKIIAKRESKSRPEQGIITVETKAFNQKGELVCVYERHLLIYKKGLGPYKKAGY